ncbi:kinase-like protein [Aspergillus udagawae]|nr:kinase-like protein [Aspergillus udagawae]
MDIQRQFPGVHWVWKGGISFIYEVYPRIVVKVPKSGEFEREQFHKEVKIYEIFSRHPPCPSVVQCFYNTGNGIFLEYMRDMSLSSRIQNNHVWDQHTMVVTKVEKLEPLHLRKKWMNDLAQAVAFLESLNLAHGDLRPENILLDRDRLKLSDFDYQCLTEDPNEHGSKVVDLLQKMEFLMLDGDPLIDDIINNCWHNKYSTVAELAAHTQTLLAEGPKQEGIDAKTISTTTQWCKDIGHIICGLWGSLGNLGVSLRQSPNDANIEVANGRESIREICDDMDEDKKKAYCQDLEKRGLLQFLSSAEPEQLGFTFEWYRHTS